MTELNPWVGDQSAADRLRSNLDYRLHPNAERLTDEQIAIVLHGLADHTMLMAAVNWNPEGSYMSSNSAASSVGQWLHRVADDFEWMREDG